VRRRIFDCFVYNGEVDLLELRLTETEGVVDRWVIVEGTHTHQGAPKPPGGDPPARLRGGRWAERIDHVLVPPRGATTGEREASQRQDVMRAVESAGARPDDLVHVSDLDEITSADAMRQFRQRLDEGGRPLMSCEHRMSYYWLNCVTGGWGAAKIGTLAAIRELAGCTHRLRFTDAPLLPQAGWHFSFMGGPSEMRRKLESYLHEELNQPHFKDERHLELCRATGFDLFLRPGHDGTFVEVDGSFPRCVRDDPQGRFRHLWADARFEEKWIDRHQLFCTCWTYGRVRHMKGAILELGCWEGRSACALASACFPEPLECIDTWGGDMNDGALDERRDVWTRFQRNVNSLTRGNVRIVRADHAEAEEALVREGAPVKFAHLDGNHHYRHVVRQIRNLQKVLVPGGVLCGDDFQNASLLRHDLEGGVERAVRELCPGFEQINNLWIWQKK
jgi:beta-1,4-mannosyl-glycoprotein beta-1,4-N-acetylglucosaminyltransferase